VAPAQRAGRDRSAPVPGAACCGSLRSRHAHPFLVISPFAKKNFISDTFISQASIPRFIEDNWLNGERLGVGSFDATTGSIMDMFDFNKPDEKTLILDPTFGTHCGYEEALLSEQACTIAHSYGFSAPASWRVPSSPPNRKVYPAKTQIRFIWYVVPSNRFPPWRSSPGANHRENRRDRHPLALSPRSRRGGRRLQQLEIGGLAVRLLGNIFRADTAWIEDRFRIRRLDFVQRHSDSIAGAVRTVLNRSPGLDGARC
jgi:hypothetical protein